MNVIYLFLLYFFLKIKSKVIEGPLLNDISFKNGISSFQYNSKCGYVEYT